MLPYVNIVTVVQADVCLIILKGLNLGQLCKPIMSLKLLVQNKVCFLLSDFTIENETIPGISRLTYRFHTDFTHAQSQVPVPDSTPDSSASDPATYFDRVVCDNEKLKLLNDRCEPPSDFIFPSTGGRKYHPLWECEYNWL